MRVFVTGATGFIGSAVVKELIAAGHQVLGLARSPEKATALLNTGAAVHRGSLEDLQDLTCAAAQCDGVIHLAFNHDFSKFVANCEDDRRVILALGSTLAGSSRPLIVTSGTAIAKTAPGAPAKEDNAALSSQTNPRAASEEAAAALAADGANVSVVRLPQVHDTARQGLVSYAIAMFRAQGVCTYVGDGENCWPAAHVLDVARLYRLAVERTEPSARYHAVAEEGVLFRHIVEAVGRRLQLPVTPIAPEAAETHFGWLSSFMTHSLPASSEQTRKKLGWEPAGPGLIADLDRLPLSEGWPASVHRIRGPPDRADSVEKVGAGGVATLALVRGVRFSFKPSRLWGRWAPAWRAS
jgi:nucleoside-diphosphate-sugar epimerase